MAYHYFKPLMAQTSQSGTLIFNGRILLKKEVKSLIVCITMFF